MLGTGQYLELKGRFDMGFELVVLMIFFGNERYIVQALIEISLLCWVFLFIDWLLDVGFFCLDFLFINSFSG